MEAKTFPLSCHGTINAISSIIPWVVLCDRERMLSQPHLFRPSTCSMSSRFPRLSNSIVWPHQKFNIYIHRIEQSTRTIVKSSVPSRHQFTPQSILQSTQLSAWIRQQRRGLVGFCWCCWGERFPTFEDLRWEDKLRAYNYRQSRHSFVSWYSLRSELSARSPV